MTEQDAIREWIKEFITKHPRAFCVKIPDSGVSPTTGLPTATGPKPCDVIAYSDGVPYYLEFKMASSRNAAAAINKMSPHQVQTLTRIGRNIPVGKIFCKPVAECVVYMPREFRIDGAKFVSFQAGKNCLECGLKAAPNFGACKKCNYSKNGKPDDGCD